MEPAAVQQKLGAAVQNVLALGELPPTRRSEAEADAFGDFRDAVKAARRDEALLGGYAEQDMVMALEFVKRRGTEKRLHAKQAKECVKILLLNSAWHRASHADAALHDSLRAFLADAPDALVRLEEAPAEAVSGKAARAAQAPRRRASSEETDSTKTLLVQAVDIMEQFGYEFPREPTAANFDTATEGYKKLYDAVNRLTSSSKPASADGSADNAYAEKLLAEVQVDWRDVLRFLCSMHSSGTRNAFRGRIENVAAKLESFSPEFRAAAAAQGGLPWRSGPSRPGQAAAVAADAVAGAGAGARARACVSDVDGAARDLAGLADFSRQSSASSSHGPARNSGSNAAEAAGTASTAGAAGAARPSGLVDQFGRFGICNGTGEELVFYVEQTAEEFRLRPGADHLFEAQEARVTVRINRPGFFGFTSLRTRLAVVELSDRSLFNVTHSENGIRVTPV